MILVDGDESLCLGYEILMLSIRKKYKVLRFCNDILKRLGLNDLILAFFYFAFFSIGIIIFVTCSAMLLISRGEIINSSVTGPMMVYWFWLIH